MTEITIRKGHKGSDDSTELAECPELSRAITQTKHGIRKTKKE